MGIRFRKSKSLGGGLKLNAGKTGIGISAGTKYARSSINTSGSHRTTFTAPGTGVSYTRTKKKKGCLPGIIGIILAVFAVFFVSHLEEQPEKPENSTEQTEQASETESKESEQSEENAESDPASNQEQKPNPEPVQKPVQESAQEPEQPLNPEPVQEPERNPEPGPVQQPEQTVTLIASAKSDKYHNPGCRYAKEIEDKIIFSSADEAEAAGYTPCKVCKP